MTLQLNIEIEEVYIANQFMPFHLKLAKNYQFDQVIQLTEPTN